MAATTTDKILSPKVMKNPICPYCPYCLALGSDERRNFITGTKKKQLKQNPIPRNHMTNVTNKANIKASSACLPSPTAETPFTTVVVVVVATVG